MRQHCRFLSIFLAFLLAFPVVMQPVHQAVGHNHFRDLAKGEDGGHPDQDDHRNCMICNFEFAISFHSENPDPGFSIPRVRENHQTFPVLYIRAHKGFQESLRAPPHA